MTLFSPYFWLICCSRFFVGFAHLAISHLPYLIGNIISGYLDIFVKAGYIVGPFGYNLCLILAIEYCGIKTRTYPLLIVMVSNTLASVAVPALAIFLPNWRALILIAICPIPLIILASFFGFVPESLSWLICEGKTELVRKTIEKVAHVNGRSLQVNISVVFFDIHHYLFSNHMILVYDHNICSLFFCRERRICLLGLSILLNQSAQTTFDVYLYCTNPIIYHHNIFLRSKLLM